MSQEIEVQPHEARSQELQSSEIELSLESSFEPRIIAFCCQY